METLLIFLGVLGFGAIMVAVHVFAEGSRSFDLEDATVSDKLDLATDFSERRSVERRSGQVVAFPLALGSEVIARDRRILPDRRHAAG